MLFFLRKLAGPACGPLLLAAAREGGGLPTPAHRSRAGARKAPATKAAEPEAALPDIGRYFDTWLWVKSEGFVATSTPETKGAARTLVLNPDLTYELHQRRDTRDSVL